MDQRDLILRLHTSFPNFTISECRELLERSNWDVNAARVQAERKEAEMIKNDHKQGTQYYAGSGQMTMLPTEKKEDAKELLEKLFQKTSESSQQDHDVEQTPSAFYGPARRLGHTEAPSPFIASTLKEKRATVIEVFQNGFLLDNGDFIGLESAEIIQGLKEMDEGYVPSFLQKLYPNSELSVTIHDKSTIKYEHHSQSFAGEGHRLCSDSAAPSIVVPGPIDASVCFNENEPGTIIILIDCKGQRKELKVNPDRHTVADVYSLAKQLEPSLPSFSLIVRGMPPRKLGSDQLSLTISEARLSRAVVTIQK